MQKKSKTASQNKYFQMLLTVIIFFTVFISYTPTALAWKPATHVYLAEQALKDAKDGKVTIERVDYQEGKVIGTIGEYAVDPDMLSAINRYTSQYKAGVLGPDAYPDIATGQQVIHPDTNSDGSDGWLKYLWRESKSGSPAVKAFATGYLTHAAGDMYGHTFVNKFTGGAFTPTPPSNAIKHVLLESYIDKLIPRPNFSASIEGVKDFIYQKMIDAKPGSDLDKKYLREGGKGTESSIPRLYSTLRYKLQQNIDSYYKRKSEYDRRYDEKIEAAKDCEPLDFSCSATALYAQAAAIQAERTAFIATAGLATTYQEYWRDDIDEGLKAWPETSHKVAKALFFNPEDKTNVSDAQEILEDYLNQHLLSMSGAPDVVGDFAGVVDKVQDALEEEIKPIKKLKENFYSFILEQATGMTLEELKKYLQNPALYFDEVMTQGEGERVNRETFHSKYWANTSKPNTSKDYEELVKKFEELHFLEKIPALYNTVVMSKLILLSPSSINQLLEDLKDSTRLKEQNVMLGFLRTLDGDNEWSGKGEKPHPEKMVLAQTCAAYRQIFMKQPGEKSEDGCSPSERFLLSFSTATQVIDKVVDDFERELAREETELQNLNTWIDQSLQMALSAEATKGTIDSLVEAYSTKMSGAEVRLCKSGRQSIAFFPKIRGTVASTQRMLAGYQPWKTLGRQHEQIISSLENLTNEAISTLDQEQTLTRIPKSCSALDTLPKVYSLRTQGIDISDTSKKLGDVTADFRNQIENLEKEVERNKQFVNNQRVIASIQADLAERILEGQTNEALELANSAPVRINRMIEEAKGQNIFGNDEISQLQDYANQALAEIQEDVEQSLKFESLPVLVFRRAQGLQMRIAEIEQAIADNPSIRADWENNIRRSINELLGLQPDQNIGVPNFPNQESLLSYDSSLKLAEEKINSFSASFVEASSGEESERAWRFALRPNLGMLSRSAVEENAFTQFLSSNSGTTTFPVLSTTSEPENAVEQEVNKDPTTPEEIKLSKEIIDQKGSMNASETLTYIILGIVLGMVGQCLRAVVGVKKSSDEASFSEEAFKDWFEMKRLIFSLIIGAVAGALGAIALLGTSLNKEFLLSIIATGYAGTDFIEGFMRTRKLDN